MKGKTTEQIPSKPPPISYINIKETSKALERNDDTSDSLLDLLDNDSNSTATATEEQMTCTSSITGVVSTMSTSMTCNSFYSARSNADQDLDYSLEDGISVSGFSSVAEMYAGVSGVSKMHVMSSPSPLKISQWAEPDSDSFAVRGANYVKDKQKIRAGASVFKLLTVDLIEVDAPIMTGICSIPNERIQMALKQENEGRDSGLPPFVFAVNIVVPGPPYYHLVMYFKVDEGQMDVLMGNVDTSFSKLAHKFFFEDDDNFRNHTFKLIPRIVEGNFIVRKAVGSTPAIMGTKLKQYYSRCPNNRYFELILDVTSSKIAAHVVSLAKGYAKNLIVDLAFVLEGKTIDMLPEKVLGCCRLMHVKFGKARKLANFPDDGNSMSDEHQVIQKQGTSNSQQKNLLPPQHIRNHTM